ncbi:acetate kinase, partial [Phenoliferia sp. Uapishka_3]
MKKSTSLRRSSSPYRGERRTGRHRVAFEHTHPALCTCSVLLIKTSQRRKWLLLQLQTTKPRRSVGFQSTCALADSYALAVNCGSSSIKFQLYDPSLTVVIAGSASNVQGSSPAKFSVKHGKDLGQKTDRTLEKDTPYEEVFSEILKEVKALLEGKHLGIVAHRIVHGGTATAPVVIHHGDAEEQSTLDQMDEVSDFAPLHNHHAMLIVKTCLTSLPEASSVLLFDTLFHTTIPEFRRTYAISQPGHPTPVPLKRYGFHGLSYASILRQMSEELKKDPKEVNLVVAHLGSGGSVCLIQGGESTNTSMGLTPLEGLPGGTRAGSIDASLIFHHTKDCSGTVEWSGRPISKAEYVLNKESGFQALTGTNDFGVITSRAFDEPSKCSAKEKEVALMTYQLYLDRLILFVTSYVATLFSSPTHNTLDGLVFSGGIGEHSVRLRSDILNSLKWVEDFSGSGGGVDVTANEKSGGGSVRKITKAGSKVAGWVVETDEELHIIQMPEGALIDSLVTLSRDLVKKWSLSRASNWVHINRALLAVSFILDVVAFTMIPLPTRPDSVSLQATQLRIAGSIFPLILTIANVAWLPVEKMKAPELSMKAIGIMLLVSMFLVVPALYAFLTFHASVSEFSSTLSLQLWFYLAFGLFQFLAIIPFAALPLLDFSAGPYLLGRTSWDPVPEAEASPFLIPERVETPLGNGQSQSGIFTAP